MNEKEYEAFRGKEASMIFQNPMTSLNPVHTIGKQLMEAYLIHEKEASKEEASKRALEILSQVGMTEPEKRLKQFPHELSGGMRQRVMIAMGMISHPKLLIADEPTTALDVTIQAQILELIRRLQKETGMAVVFITHNLGVVAEICDSVAVMYAGSIVEKGDAREVFYEPKHPYTLGLLRSMPSMEPSENERLIPIPGNPVNLLELPEGCAFRPRCEKACPQCESGPIPMRSLSDSHQFRCCID
ncbi:MAG: ABC transporter ATP-binding protein, partial [Lachnospiraceae bacterium]|nr:ABC transporter ATP-binding protein [Lachnospiraceae bacterium]